MFLKKLVNFSLFLFLGFCAQFIEGAAAVAAVCPKLDIDQVEIRKFNIESPAEVNQARELFAQAFFAVEQAEAEVSQETLCKYRTTFNVSCIEKMPQNKNMYAYVAIFNEKIVGIVVVDKVEQSLWIDWLAVDPSCFKCGIGRKIIKFLRKQFVFLVREIKLIALNDKAATFYEKLGFEGKDEGDKMVLSLKYSLIALEAAPEKIDKKMAEKAASLYATVFGCTDFRYFLERKTHKIFCICSVGEFQKEVVGFMVAETSKYFDEFPGLEILKITNLAVDPKKQREGLGQFALSEIEKFYPEIKTMILDCTSKELVTFYKKCGFECYHETPRGNDFKFAKRINVKKGGI